jgi:hypothetical protein
MNLIEQISETDFLGRKEDYFVDKETGEQFRRIYGGICLPGIKTGALTVLGEFRQKDESKDKHHIKMLYEYPKFNPSELVKRAVECSASLKVNQWYGNPSGSQMEILEKIKYRLYIETAPFTEDKHGFKTYLNLIREFGEKKLLHFSSESCLPPLLTKLDLSKITDPDSMALEQPEISSLCFALAALVVWEYDSNEKAKVEAANAILEDFYDD